MKVAVFGAGTMGSGIAQVFAAKGHTARKKRRPKMATYKKQKSSKSDDFEDFWYAVRDSNPRPSGP